MRAFLIAVLCADLAIQSDLHVIWIVLAGLWSVIALYEEFKK